MFFEYSPSVSSMVIEGARTKLGFLFIFLLCIKKEQETLRVVAIAT